MQPLPMDDAPHEEPESHGASGGRNLPIAIATGLGLAGLVFGTLFWRPAAWFVLVAVVLLLAQYELYSVLAKRGYRPAIPLGLAGGAVVLAGAYWRGTQALSFGVVLTLIGAFLWFFVDANRERVARSIAATILGVVYVPMLGAHAILMRSLPDGIELTIAFIAAVALYDVGAYASGSFFGKHKIAPAVSPSKTWEGAAGATIFVFFMALIIGPHLGPLDLGSSALLAGASALLSPIGDLAESMIKRDLDVKDMGTIFPGHGGALDRVDALLFVAPAVYWLYRIVVL
jgi:phosphatidate cytidylyltransferase